ncbi:hypothetical protein [Rhizobium leguminosarum]|uniref:hypothetical protein n=1 Tax=Rhizobium leguminosarum TaxID=384 RepID=UPI001C97E4B6|nr:hypothetical protein [Rhizobium leguminosarum]MBY5318220.1 hypothetical protein [Rhizobium leguminosarum]
MTSFNPNPTAAEVRAALQGMTKGLKRAHVVPYLRPLLTEAGRTEIESLARILGRYLEDHLPGYLKSWMTTLVAGWPDRFPIIHAADVALDGILSASLLSLGEGRQVPDWIVHGSSSWIYDLQLGRPNEVTLRSRAAAVMTYRGSRMSADHELNSQLEGTIITGEFENHRQKRDLSEGFRPSAESPADKEKLARIIECERISMEMSERQRFEERISMLIGSKFKATKRTVAELRALLKESYFARYPERVGQPLMRHELWGWGERAC